MSSSGEYLMNMDSDDELFGEDSLAYLYNHTLISKVDIVSFNVYFQKDKVTVKCQRKNEIQKQPNLFNYIIQFKYFICLYIIYLYKFIIIIK